MSEKLNILGTTVEPGKKVMTKVKVGSLPDSSPLEIPVVLIGGSKPGPVLCLNAGIHGTELTGIDIVRRAALEMNPGEISGAVVAIPACNPLAYDFRQHVVGRENPWLSFPGNPSLSWNLRLDYILLNEIFSKTNCILDFHSGDNEVYEQYIYVVDDSETYPKVGKSKMELARAFGTGLPIYYEVVPHDERTPSHHAGLLGIPLLTPEIGGGQTVHEKDVQRGLTGIANVMKHLGMVGGNPEPSQQLHLTEIQSVWATHGGFLTPEVSPLEVPYKVSKGQVLARIADLLGNEVDVIKSELDGLVVMAALNRAVRTGDWLYELGPISTTAKPMTRKEVYT